MNMVLCTGISNFGWDTLHDKNNCPKNDGRGRKTVQIYRHFKLLLAFISTFMLKNKVGWATISLAR